MEKAIRVCPVCGREYSDYPAISRRDNVTEICPDCGVMEALEDFVAYLEKKREWRKKKA